MRSNRTPGVAFVSGVLGAMLLGLLLARGAFGLRAVPVEVLAGGGVAALLACLVWSRRAAGFSGERREELSEREGSSRPPRDVLRDELGADRVAERDGVQWALKISPERIAVPGYVVAGILLQNAFDRPRIATLRLREGPGAEAAEPIRVALKPGETGLQRVPLFLSGDLRPGRRRFAVDLSAVAPEGEGERLVERAGRAQATAQLEILERHAGDPVNLWAFDWTGFRPIFSTGQSRADLEPLRLLDDLRQRP